MNLMDLPVIQADGNPSGTVAVDEAVFGVPFKEPLVHQVVTAYLAGGREPARRKTGHGCEAGGESHFGRKVPVALGLVRFVAPCGVAVARYLPPAPAAMRKK